jgi:hypothetical protein
MIDININKYNDKIFLFIFMFILLFFNFNNNLIFDFTFINDFINGGNGVTDPNMGSLGDSQKFKDSLHIMIVSLNILSFAIFIFVLLDIIDVLNEQNQQKGSSSFAMKISLKMIAGSVFANAEKMATYFDIKV